MTATPANPLETLEQQIAALLQPSGNLTVPASMFGSGPTVTAFNTYLAGALSLTNAVVGFSPGVQKEFNVNGVGASAPFIGMNVASQVTQDDAGFEIIITATAVTSFPGFDVLWTLNLSCPAIGNQSALAGVGFNSADFVLQSRNGGSLTFSGNAAFDSTTLSYLQVFFPPALQIGGTIDAVTGGVPVFSWTTSSTPLFSSLGVSITPGITLGIGAPVPPEAPVETVTFNLSIPIGSRSIDITTSGFQGDLEIDGTFTGFSFSIADLTPLYDFAALMPPQMPNPGMSLTSVNMLLDPDTYVFNVTFNVAFDSGSDGWPIIGNVSLSDVTIAFTLTNVQIGTSGVQYTAPVHISLGAILNVDKYEVSIGAYYPGFVFTGSLEPGGKLDLQTFIGAFYEPAAQLFPPLTLPIDLLAFQLDPSSPSYAFQLEMLHTAEWNVIPNLITVTDISFAFEYAASNFDVEMSGKIALATLTFELDAGYSTSEDGAQWQFGASTSATGEDIVNIAKAIGLPSFTPPEVTADVDLSLTIAPEGTTYSFDVDATWTQTVGNYTLTLNGTMQLTSTDAVVGGSVTIDPGGFEIGAQYDFVEQEWTITFGGIDAVVTNEQATFSFPSITIGEVIDYFVDVAAGEGSGFALPPPFDLLNDIGVDASVIIDFNEGQLYVDLSLDNEVPFGSIQGIQIGIDFDDADNVTVTFTDGTFNGNEITEGDEPEVSVTEPESEGVASTPGMGGDAFSLQYLLLAQRLAPPTLSDIDTTSISTAVTSMQKYYADPPGPGSQIAYTPSVDWVIATQFEVVGIFQVYALFYDPSLYGIEISVSENSENAFSGLDFQILYKRVTSSVGVYEIDLTLPMGMRVYSFGEVTIILPAVMVQIYTNGNFLVDFGFPQDNDWSDCFSVQVFPFVGFGGFYFGVLNGSTADLPQSSSGTYAPVVLFGVALSLGVGDTITAGVLTAGLSLTVAGIAEGMFAWFNPYASGEPTSMYYSITGVFALVGNVYGVINFYVVTARFDISAQISATISFATGSPVTFTFTAEVQVTASLTINLGVFSITLPFSFETSISDTYTLGDGSSSNDDVAVRRGPRRRIALGRRRTLPDPVQSLSWVPVTGTDTIALLLAPYLTATDAQPGISAGPQIVAMTFISAQSQGDTPSPFSLLCGNALLWTVNALLQIPPEPGQQYTTTDRIMEELVGKGLFDTIASALQSGAASAIPSPGDVTGALAQLLTFNIQQATNLTSGGTVSVFPMLPELQLTTTGGATIEFGSQNMVSSAELSALQQYFASLIPPTPGSTTSPLTPVTYNGSESMATFILTDFFLLLCRAVVQAAQQQFGTITNAQQSIDDLVAECPGLTPESLAGANRLRSLRPGATIDAGGRSYEVNDGDTLLSIARRYRTTPEALARANCSVRGFFAAGTQLTIGDRPPNLKPLRTLVTALMDGPFDALAGTVARIMLQGLRPPWPAPQEVTAETPTEALYIISGQQFDATGVTSSSSFSLSSSVDWIAFDGASSITVDITEQQATTLPHLHGPLQIQFTSEMLPVRKTVARSFRPSGPMSWNGTSTIWNLPADLQQLLVSGVEPVLVAMEQASNDNNGVPDTPTGALTTTWLMTFPIVVQLIPSLINSGSTLVYTYNLIGTDDVGTALLQQFLLASGGGDALQSINLLYAPQPANGAASAGCISNDPSTNTLFVVQTNLSTNSDTGEPPADAPIGESPLSILTAIWECTVVRAGGYYLYYSSNASGSPLGLPSYLFNNNGEAEVTVAVTVNLPNGALTSYVNSVAIEPPYDSANPTLVYLTSPELPTEPALLQSIPAMTPGTAGLFVTREFSFGSGPSSLEDTFHLLGYRIAPLGGFTLSMVGLPLTPMQDGANQGPLNFYKTYIPITANAIDPGVSTPYEDAPPPVADPYRGIGTELELMLQWHDIFGNSLMLGMPGILSASPHQQVLYFDALVPVSSWPSIGAYYTITGPPPTLTIALDFDTTRYQGDTTASTNAAQNDFNQYAPIYYQIARNVTISVECSLDPLVAQDVTQNLLAFVVDIYSYLGSVLAGNPTTPPQNVTLSFPVQDSWPPPAPVAFPLAVGFIIARTASLVDPLASSPGDPAVSVSSSVKPSFEVTGVNTLQLTQFATSFNEAFPSLMVATQHEAGTSGSTLDQVWVVRFGRSGVQCTYDAANNPVIYYATAPLAGTLVSAPNVPMPVYQTEVGLLPQSEWPAQSFTNVDIDLLAMNFLAAVDQVLTADYAAPAWLAWNAGGATPPDPISQILSAKSLLATALANQLAAINPAPVPTSDALQAAQTMMQQELLVRLSSAYQISALVQFEAQAAGPEPTNGNPAQFHAKVQAAGGSTAVGSFSSVSVPLTSSSYPTFAFTTNNIQSNSDSISIPVTLTFNHLQFAIENIGASGYQSGSWLTFPLAPSNASTHVQNAVNVSLGTLDIPLPLRAFASAPVLFSQSAVPLAIASNESWTLSNLTQWDYVFGYSYTGITQDDIEVAIDLTGGGAPSTTASLAQWLIGFNAVYPQILADLNSSVCDQESATTLSSTAQGALTAFASLAGSIAAVWGPITTQEPQPQFTISNGSTAVGTVEDVFALTVQAASGTTLQFPSVDIAGYTAASLSSPPPDAVVYTYTDTNGDYLTAEQAAAIAFRTVTVPGFDVLAQQQVWSSIAIERNPDYPSFTLTTPYISYITPVVPLIAVPPAVVIPIGSPVAPGGIAGALQSAFNTFLAPGASGGSWLVQLTVSFEYVLNAPAGLSATIPVLMLLPTGISAGSSTIGTVASTLESWLSTNNLSEGTFIIAFSLFASQSIVASLTLPLLTATLSLQISQS